MRTLRLCALATMSVFGIFSMGSVGCGCVTEVACCDEFAVGATLGGEVSSSVGGQIAAQAVADVAGVASSAVEDITTACRAIAQDLDAPKDAQTSADATTPRRAKMEAWCSLAISVIGSVRQKARGSLTFEATPPRCSLSMRAKASCQAQCSGSAACDLKANPPRCSGSLKVACKGECRAKANATLHCEGRCSGTCRGACTASGAVAGQCKGHCEGTCSADATGGGNGTTASGECDGFCKGKCTMRADAPAVACDGACEGECSASCTGTAEVAATCDGECATDFEPISCEGGKLEGGCQVDAKCDANCDASLKAKAQCSPPEVAVVLDGAADVQAASKLTTTLEANLPVLLTFRARLEGMGEVLGKVRGNIDGFTEIKVACVPPIAAAAAGAAEDAAASTEATTKVLASVGG